MNPLKAAQRLYALRASWLGDGGAPVPVAQAKARAQTCLACPENDSRWWEGIARHAVQWALKIDAVRATEGLTTGVETGLHVCRACDCILRSKCWVPLKHVLATTPLDALPSNCWIKTESAPPLPPS